MRGGREPDCSTADDDEDFRNSNMAGRDLSDQDLSYMDCSGSNFSECDLSRSELMWSVLDDCNFLMANLEYANLLGASLRNADLRQVNFTGVVLNGADLQGAVVDQGVVVAGYSRRNAGPILDWHFDMEYVIRTDDGYYCLYIEQDRFREYTLPVPEVMNPHPPRRRVKRVVPPAAPTIPTHQPPATTTLEADEWVQL